LLASLRGCGNDSAARKSARTSSRARRGGGHPVHSTPACAPLVLDALGIEPANVGLEPVWARLSEAGVPFVLHVGGGKLLPREFHENGRPRPVDWLGGGENLRGKDFPVLHHSPERFLACLVATLEEAVTGGADADIIRADREFHHTAAALAGLPRARARRERLLLRLRRVTRRRRPDETLHRQPPTRHRRTLAAIAAPAPRRSHPLRRRGTGTRHRTRNALLVEGLPAAGDTWRHREARFEGLPWFSDLCFSVTRPLARSWPRMFSTSIGLRPEAVDSPASGHTGVDAVVISDAYHQGQRGIIHRPGPGGA
jgi:hypothetical protein